MEWCWDRAILLYYTMKITINVISLLVLVTEISNLSTFPFDTKFVICKDRHLHIPKPNLENPEEESPSSSSETSALTTAHKTSNENECENKVPVEKGNWCKKGMPKLIDSERRDPDEEHSDLDLSLPALKP